MIFGPIDILYRKYQHYLKSQRVRLCLIWKRMKIYFWVDSNDAVASISNQIKQEESKIELILEDVWQGQTESFKNNCVWVKSSKVSFNEFSIQRNYCMTSLFILILITQASSSSSQYVAPASAYIFFYDQDFITLQV